MVPQLKIAPLFCVVSSTFVYFHPYFTRKQVQFCQKRTPFFGISSTLSLTHPLFGHIKNREKLIYLDKI